MADAPRVLIASDELTAGARLVACLLWSYADPRAESPFAWPSASTLGRGTAQTERAVRRHLAALVAAGWIGRARRESAGRVRLVWVLNRDRADTGPTGHRDTTDTGPTGHRDPPDPEPWPSGPPDRDRADPPTVTARPPELTREPTREPTTTPVGGGVSSGILFELDHIRREVEAETGKRFGGLTRRADRLAGLEDALAESGLEELREVVRHRCRLVASGDVSQALWRSTFVGDGYHAAREAYLVDVAKTERAAADAAAEQAERDALERDRLTPERLAELTSELGSVLRLPRDP